MNHAQLPADALTEDRAMDLTELDEASYQRFMQRLLADVARQRRMALAQPLPTLQLALA